MAGAFWLRWGKNLAKVRSQARTHRTQEIAQALPGSDTFPVEILYSAFRAQAQWTLDCEAAGSVSH